jgi:hypothetical protein
MAFGLTGPRHKKLMLMAYEDARHYFESARGNLHVGNCRATVAALRHANRAMARARAHEASSQGSRLLPREHAMYAKNNVDSLRADLETLENELFKSGCAAEQLGVQFRR